MYFFFYSIAIGNIDTIVSFEERGHGKGESYSPEVLFPLDKSDVYSPTKNFGQSHYSQIRRKV